ncbi:LysR family transcriptional regulator [Pseudomonas syringae]|uniref:LysR substrate-binding domain-containing protein n=1 Tax=Pseudomonas syringae TaxID=317 RepID=UPI001F2F6F3C|nr:LysR substrate-binding domain-containing protein [Pseudomonas syringae]MCF5670416.1 LysR family transcriptional regulator [Pseudomonas syringae]
MNKLRTTLPPLASLLPFEAAARLESFSKAADELHITQAAVSRQIRGLEEDLGLKLFIRRNRAVFLTEEGRELGGVISAALLNISDAAVALRTSRRKHRVVLLCQLCEAFYWMMQRLSTFLDQHSGVEVQVVTSTRPIAEFSGYFDVALQTTGRASGCHTLVFTAADEVFPVCRSDYLAPGSLLSLKELRLHKLLHYRSTPHEFMTWDDWSQMFGSTRADYPQGAVFDSYPLMLQAAVEGHGVALGWRRTASKLIEEGALVQCCAERVPLPDAISVYKKSHDDNRVEVRMLLDWLREQLVMER